MNESSADEWNLTDSQCVGGDITFRWMAANATIQVGAPL